MKKKKILSVILAGILSFGLISCGNSKEDSSGSDSGGKKRNSILVSFYWS